MMIQGSHQRKPATVILGLGVCARDEASTIAATLSSIVRAVSFAAQIDDWRLVVCANGCKDGTMQAVEGWARNQADKRVSLCVLEEANLVEAQRLIATRLVEDAADIFGFFDADILVAPDCIIRLLESAAVSAARAVYAVSVPLSDGSETLIQRVLNQYDRDKSVFSRRKHLHGRAFLTKEWHIPETSPPLLADDIYLSCDLLLRYGEHAIGMCADATVYFHQISTLTDFYSSYRRRQIELRKCLRINPLFSLLPQDQLNRRLVPKKLIAEPPKALALWCIFFLIRIYCRIRLWVEVLMSRESVVWQSTSSSKRCFDPELTLD